MLVSRLREVEAIIREELLLLTPVNRVREHDDRNILRELFQCFLIVFQSLNRMLILQVHICPLESTLVRKVRITTTNMKHDRTLVKALHHFLAWFKNTFLKLKVLANIILDVLPILHRLIETIQVHAIRHVLIQVFIEVKLSFLSILFGRMESDVPISNISQTETIMDGIVVHTSVRRWKHKVKPTVCCNATQSSILEHLIAQTTIVA